MPKVVDVDLSLLEVYCRAGSSLAEVASAFGCSEKNIERVVKREYSQQFVDYRNEKAAIGRTALRQAQMEKALAGDVTMLIWLGKNMLGQTDKSVAETDAMHAAADTLDSLKEALQRPAVGSQKRIEPANNGSA